MLSAFESFAASVPDINLPDDNSSSSLTLMEMMDYDFPALSLPNLPEIPTSLLPFSEPSSGPLALPQLAIESFVVPPPVIETESAPLPATPVLDTEWSLPGEPMSLAPEVAPLDLPAPVIAPPLALVDAPPPVSAPDVAVLDAPPPVALPDVAPVVAEPAPAPVVDEWGNDSLDLAAAPVAAAPVAEPVAEPVFVGPPAAEEPAAPVIAPPAPVMTTWLDHDIALEEPAPVVDQPPADSVSAPPEAAPESAVASPVSMPGEIESRPLPPLPPEQKTAIAQKGDSITRLVGNDLAAVGEFAVRNGLRNSTIVAGREYDTTPIDRANLTPAEISQREQIGQAFFNRDNARLAALAEAAQQRQIAQQEAAARAQQSAALPDMPFGSGQAMPGSFMAGATPPPPSIFATTAPALPKDFLTDKATNPAATLAHSPGVVLGRSAFNTFGYDANMPSTVRSAGQTGFTPGVTAYQVGDVSLLGINNYSVTSVNSAALGGSMTLLATEGNRGLTGSVVVTDKAQSLLTDTMFETLPNGVGRPGETLRAELAGKFLFQAQPITEVKTDGIYAGMEKRSVSAALGSFTAGLGGSLEVQNPFNTAGKIGFEGSGIVDLNMVESKQMSAMGSVADPANGIYGASFGYETRNRLASASLTLNGGVDAGFVRGKVSTQAFVSAGAFGGGGTASWAFNDNEGSLTFQGTASVLAGLGGGLDVSGKVQADWAKGLVKEYVVPVGNWLQKGTNYIHGALTGVSFVPGPIGAAASALDAGVSYLEGDKTGAAIGLAAAGIGAFSDAGAVKAGLTAGNAVIDAVKLAKLETSAGSDAVKAATEVFEVFDKSNARNGLTIGDRTALIDAQSNHTTLILNGVSEAEVVSKFLEITGTKALPVAAKLETKTGVGVRYTVETEAGNFTLRNASTSPMPGGNGGWTLDVPTFLNAAAPTRRTEIKFPTPQTPPVKP